MSITINGNGTITGYTPATVADGGITAAKLASGVGGKILQAQNTTVTAISTVSANSSWEDTSITCSITPSSTNSKILINLTVSGEGNSSNQRNFTHRMKKVVGGTTSYIQGATVSNRVSHLGSTGDLTNDATTTASSFSVTGLLDENITSTDAITYTLQMTYASASGGGTYYINRNVADQSGSPRFLSWITLLELSS